MSLHSPEGNGREAPLPGLRRFARRPAAAVERCELCSAVLPGEHEHLLDLSRRQLVCACDPCAILFSNQSAAKYRRVRRQAKLLADFRLSDADWESLNIPINLAFFFISTPAGRVLALYPSPAGATEANVDAAAWQELVDANPVLSDFQPDVEALLVNRVGTARDCYRVSIDECFHLVGVVRQNWRGLSGGTKVWGEIARFFAGLRERSEAPAHA